MFQKLVDRPMTDEEYASEWMQSAVSFDKEGHYTWMTTQLGQPGMILEIGCGGGFCTENLARAGKRVLALDVNTFAIDSAFQRLRAAGIEVDRIDVALLRDLNYSRGPQVIMAHVNVFDQSLPNMLPSKAFDAIVCWLIGSAPTSQAEWLKKKLTDFDGTEMAVYREAVHSRCYELGDAILKDGGVVHIVDRLGISSWNDKDYLRSEVARTWQDIAGPHYNITKDNCFLRRIEISTMISSKIGYVAQMPGGLVVLASSRAIRTAPSL